MNVKRSMAPTCLTAFIIVILGWTTPGLSAREYFVSQDGSDAGPGTDAEPFRTIQKAAWVVQPGDVCTILPGRYREMVTMRHAGTVGQPVVFRAARPGTVVIDGTAPITGAWSQHAPGIFKTTHHQSVYQLFHDRRMMIQARWPNVKFDQLLERDASYRKPQTLTRDTITDVELARAEMDFTGARMELRASREISAWKTNLQHQAGSDILKYPPLPPGTVLSYASGPWVGQRYYLYGLLNMLDSPGEWFHDVAKGTLYLMTLDGNAPTPGTVRTTVRSHGVYAQRLNYITLQGLTFFGCTAQLDECNGTVVEDCDFWFPSTGRILGTSRNGFHPVTFLTGNDVTVRGCSLAYAQGAGFFVRGSRNVVEDCLVHDIDWSGKGNNAGIRIDALWFNVSRPGTSAGNSVVRHCTVYNSGNKCIETHNQPSNRIEYCHAFNGGMLAGDVAIIHTGRRTIEGTSIHHNWVHDNHGLEFVIGIRGDDQTRGLSVHHNVIFDINGQGIIAKGDRNHIFNNTIFNVWRRGMPVRSDILAFSEPEPNLDGQQRDLLPRQNAQSLIVNNANRLAVGSRHLINGRPVKPGGKQASNYETNDVGQQLVDPAKFDFRPKRGSPLIDRGQVISGITDGHKGSSPDVGAYEFGAEPWKPGIRWSQAKLNRHYDLVRRFGWPGSKTGSPASLVAALAAPGTHPKSLLKDDPFFADAESTRGRSDFTPSNKKWQATEDDDPFFSGAKTVTLDEEESPFFKDAP